jgi:hypothetical protein
MNNTSAAKRPTFNTASMLSLHETYSRVADIDLS